MSQAANHRAPALRLSAADAFFVAYQQRSGVLMQLGGEADVEGEVTRDDLEQMLAHLVARWPQLGQTLQKSVVGLSWAGGCLTNQMLSISNGSHHIDGNGIGGNAETARWRNVAMDPFQEPPFQVLWVPKDNGGILAYRAHHAVMDGESFFLVGGEASRILARRKGTRQRTVFAGEAAGAVKLTDLVSRKQLRPEKLRSMWRYVQWLGSEARAGRSARLAMDSCSAGDTHTVKRTFDREAVLELKRQAAEVRVMPMAWCAAAWMRAIHAWNSSRGAASNPLISLEVPVSLRRARNKDRGIVGNFISPLVVFADATLPLAQVARDLKAQLTRALRAQAHLSMPLLSAPAKFLPWSLFRRIAVSPKTTGFATSHFTWFEPAGDLLSEVARISKGNFRITARRIYTPVCLHMGAALAVVASSESAQFFITYRGNAFSPSDAEQLMDLLMAELGSQVASHQFKTATR
jgi:hypothetical protein